MPVVTSDMNGFPESGIPVLKNARGVAYIEALNPLLGTGFLRHTTGTGVLTIDGNNYVTYSTLSSYVPYSGAYTDLNLGSYNIFANRGLIGSISDDGSSVLQVQGQSRFSNPNNLAIYIQGYSSFLDRVGIGVDPYGASTMLEVANPTSFSVSLYPYSYDFWTGYSNIAPGSAGGTYYDSMVYSSQSFYDGGDGYLYSNYDYHIVGTIDYSTGYITTTSHLYETIEYIYFTYSVSSTPICARFHNGVFMHQNVNYGITLVSSTYSLGDSDRTIFCTGNGYLVYLPDATTCVGREYYIKKIGTGTITITMDWSQPIDGQTSITLDAYECITVISTGTEWIII